MAAKATLTDDDIMAYKVALAAEEMVRSGNQASNVRFWSVSDMLRLR